MRRSFKFQIKPTSKQSTSLAMMLTDHCVLYNAALQERRDAYRRAGVSIRYGEQSAQLKEIRASDPDRQGRWSFTSQQQTLRRLNKAFEAFFRRVKTGQAPGYPRFRSAARFNTVDFVAGDGARWDSTPKASTSAWAHVYFHGIGHVKVNQHRAVRGRVKQITLKREGTTTRPRWFVVLSCDDVPTEPLPATGKIMGLDLATGENGLAYTVSVDTTTGDVTTGHLPGIRAYHRAQARLSRLQQAAAASRPKPGRRASARHRRNLDRVRALHAKTARIRADYLHKTARALIEANDIVVVEGLRPANMTRRPAPRPNPRTPGGFLPNNAAAKAGLNKSILDSAWNMFISLIDAKAECAGRQVIRVNPAYTSQTCHACGNIDADARHRKQYACTNPDCGWTGDADTNAAHNILRAGLVQQVPAP